ncbi:P-loop containing nucleoside triphosphate hydrolase protein [Tuber brumale]|nr:P-loop containing nucleoside triphosphate hydrolase protein [Tuber brumale]
MLWRTLDQKFEAARKEIEANVQRFDRGGRTAVDCEIVDGVRVLRGHLPTTVTSPTEPENLYEVPYTRNNNFYGRGEALDALHKALVKNIDPRGSSQTVTEQSSCVVYGMGGVGKTQVALEYTYRHRDSYDFIFWIQAENEAVLVTSITKISSALGLHKAGNASRKEAIVEGVRKCLEKTKKRWLLVFDNAETWSLLEPCLPRANHGAVLVTSQDNQLGARSAEELHLEPFNSTEGSELLLKHLARTGAHREVEDARKISTQLGGLPLALGYVAGYISITRWSLKEFLNAFENPQVSASIFAMTPPTTTHQYEKSLEKLCEASLKKLEENQQKVIQILSMLNPDGVPGAMLYTDHPDQPDLDFLSSSKIPDHDTMIGNLASWHLVTLETAQGKTQLSIHRSLQKSILHHLDKNPALFQQIFRLAFALIRKAYPKQSPTHDPQNEHWGTQELYQPHILSLHSVYEKYSMKPTDVEQVAFAELLSDSAYYFWERGTLRDGKLLTNTAENICVQYPGSYRIEANVYSLGAALRWSRGITKRAPTLRRLLRALALLQKHINELTADEVTPEILRLYATSWNDIAAAFIDHEFYEDAIRCLDLCISIKRGLGDQLGVWGANRNKAVALAWLGRSSEALQLIPAEGSEILPDLLALKCASFYQRCQFGWAIVLVMSGKFNRAHDLLQEVLGNRKRLCGEAGLLTLDTYYMLGITQRKMGNTEEAIDYFKKALEDPANWSEESQSVAKHHLSKALFDIDEQAEAQKLSAEADAARQRLWDKHARYLRAKGQHDDETYDHLAPCDMGRTTIGRFHTSGKLPQLMKICWDIQGRLDGLETGSIESAYCRACKSPEIDVSEAEIYSSTE